MLRSMTGAFAGLALLSVASVAVAQTGPPPLPTGVPAQPPPAGSANQSLPFPTMQGTGITYPQTMIGQVIRRVWVEPQIVAIQVYVRQPEGIPEVWQTQQVEIPGYWATETTKGTVYPPRWTLENPGAGVYQWRQLPGYFQQR